MIHSNMVPDTIQSLKKLRNILDTLKENKDKILSFKNKSKLNDSIKILAFPGIFLLKSRQLREG